MALRRLQVAQVGCEGTFVAAEKVQLDVDVDGCDQAKEVVILDYALIAELLQHP